MENQVRITGIIGPERTDILDALAKTPKDSSINVQTKYFEFITDTLRAVKEHELGNPLYISAVAGGDEKPRLYVINQGNISEKACDFFIGEKSPFSSVNSIPVEGFIDGVKDIINGNGGHQYTINNIEKMPGGDVIYEHPKVGENLRTVLKRIEEQKRLSGMITELRRKEEDFEKARVVSLGASFFGAIGALPIFLGVESPLLEFSTAISILGFGTSIYYLVKGYEAKQESEKGISEKFKEIYESKKSMKTLVSDLENKLKTI